MSIEEVTQTLLESAKPSKSRASLPIVRTINRQSFSEKQSDKNLQTFGKRQNKKFLMETQ